MTRYLSVEQVVSLHQGLTGVMSGDPGIRDLRALDAAVLRPTTSFAGEDLYPTLEAKAASLMHALIATTPFVLASKGTAVIAAECFLAANGVGLAATDQDLLQVVGGTERGELGVEALAIWFSQRVTRRASS
jgi:death-on-curing protein